MLEEVKKIKLSSGLFTATLGTPNIGLFIRSHHWRRAKSAGGIVGPRTYLSQTAGGTAADKVRGLHPSDYPSRNLENRYCPRRWHLLATLQ